ncbi:hypothetical protein AK812_SmicGene22075 [Symbiodinium microadriaticum]|uniref:Uncharacterized protein n=1 Tax=Symbiodinium microadriaticum TaxID=2951 RepID=A0A1Q9DKR7_SYMMI|nr:hypothetical protein AK812_SmicGene22075 [Symbiodinium microadriaticum]
MKADHSRPSLSIRLAFGKMEMEGAALALAGAAILLTFHFYAHGHRLQSLPSLLGCSKSEASDVDEKLQKDRAEHIQEELWKVRARTYHLIVSFMVHAAPVMTIVFLYEFAMMFSYLGLARLVCMFLVYMLHTSVISGRLPLNPATLQVLYILYYGSFAMLLLGGIFHRESEAKERSMQAFNDGARLLMAVVIMHKQTALPAQLAISASEIVVYWFHHNDVADTAAFAGVQLVFAIASVGVTVTLEYWVTSHISALLHAESMVGSFRRMLRGVCDGEVLLKEDMSICENAECIKHLLMTQSSFKGRHFQQLLMPDEEESFTGFMKQSTDDMLAPEDRRTSTPPCLRVSLRGASDIRVGVDLWHVPMPHLFAAKWLASAWWG